MTDTPGIPLQSCRVFYFIFALLLKTSFWANFESSYHIILLYLVKHNIQRNSKRRGGKRICAGREKSPSFTKITRKWISNISEQIIAIYIWKIDGKGYINLENQAFSTLNLRQCFRLRVISHVYWFFEFGSICRCLPFPRRVHRTWVLWYNVRSIITICLEFSTTQQGLFTYSKGLNAFQYNTMSWKAFSLRFVALFSGQGEYFLL